MGGYGWGNVQESELIDAVHAALDQGVNFFDTADTYGLGQSEITLGKALGSRRKDVVVASKFGVRVGDGKTVYDNSPAWIEEALHGSLKRLGTDYIDLYQVHYRDGITPIGLVVETLEKLMGCVIFTRRICLNFGLIQDILSASKMNTVWPAEKMSKI